MATRAHRIAEFNTGAPPDGSAVQVLCEDHNGTYIVPFPCHHVDGKWLNAATHAVIDCAVVGWRIKKH